MAARPKAAPAAESKQAAGEKASAELSAMLEQAAEDASPKDAEQPKPAAKKNGGNGEKKGEAKKEPTKAEEKAEAKPKKKKLTKLSEVDGTIRDGETVRVGVAMMGGAREGEIIAKAVVIPKKFSLVKPTKGHMVHVVDDDHTGTTLCTLKTDWASGATVMPDETPITCDPCLWRMLAIKKTTQAEQTKRLADARAKADKLVAEAKAKVEQAKKDKAAAEAKKTVAAQPQAKADPKPAAAKKSPRRKRAAA